MVLAEQDGVAHQPVAPLVRSISLRLSGGSIIAYNLDVGPERGSDAFTH